MARIMVIDDEPAIRKLLRLTLEAHGHEVLVAADGKEAAPHFSNGIDLVITDILMPECDGLETMSTLKVNYPRIKVIAITGGGSLPAKTCLKLAESFGADRVLQKPIPNDTLLSTIAEVLS